MTQRTVYLSFLVTCGTILISCVAQFRAARRVDAAELYALRAARDYEFAVLIQKTKELNQAALAVMRGEINNPCIRRTYNGLDFQTPSFASFRRSAPLPAIRTTADKPKRASHQSD